MPIQSIHSQPERRRLSGLATVLWTLVGAVVALYVFFLAIGGIDPGDAVVASLVVALLAAAWAVHYFFGRPGDAEHRDQTDRERRGF
jgi:hypothetical protein